MMRKLKESAIGDFVAKEFKYPRSCKTAYHDRAKAENQKKVEKATSAWQRKKDMLEKALQLTITFMETRLFFSALFCAFKTSLTSIYLH